ncbi:hypothetical protein GYMLUDRAFT_241448 [Collybiopsis luxurians FD-317 M1]|uniref:Mid2 domain-containing protein n=1 Tax=Collybiopsis luxurians FD-317 M1 TaxID=944289 RepID=A0A0D0C7S3_9AGAR|nr:hypothetical protein GYMLUDRAFT_241448 [Collybiopsis luxurians FD-317 M1]
MKSRSVSTTFPSSSPSLLFLLLFGLGSVTTAEAQMPPDTNLFQWKFSQNFLGPLLPSCQNLPITVQPVNPTNQTHGIPPFYMIAWEIGGTPRTTLLGLNESSLSWTVDHPVGTSLWLNVVDSQGNGGGIPPSSFTVSTGQSTECIVHGNNTEFTVTANISSTVETCQPWGLRIKGGNPPYNVSFAQLNSPIVTNVTIPASMNGYTYINRATPNFPLIAAVSDMTGRWASGTPIVNPVGSSDVDCTGLNSSPGFADQLQAAQDAATAAIAKAKQRKTAVLAGVLTPLFVLLFGGVAFWAYRNYTRQQRMKKELAPEPMVLPEPKAVEEANTNTMAEIRPSFGSQVSSIVDTHNSPSQASSRNPFLTDAERSTILSRSNDSSEQQLVANSSRPNSGSSSSSTSRGGFANFPTSSVRRPNKKAVEAGFANQSDSKSVAARGQARTTVERSQSAQASASAAIPMPVRSASLSAIISQSLDGEEYVIQHQDGGRFRELPPPYRERRSRPQPDVPQSP